MKIFFTLVDPDFIWVFTVCESTHLEVSKIQRVKLTNKGIKINTLQCKNVKILYIGNFCEGLMFAKTSHMQSFRKIKS